MTQVNWAAVGEFSGDLSPFPDKPGAPSGWQFV